MLNYPAMLRLEFDRGTLLLCAGRDELPEGVELPGCVYDRRVGAWRAPAQRYREVLTALHRAGVEIENAAGGFEPLPLQSRLVRKPFPHQAEAVDTWWNSGRRGVVVLPTGAGKTYVAQLIMERLGKSTLVVTPTLDLMQQWYGVLSTGFEMDVGLVGGGYHEVEPITVTTYDSAYIHMERFGDQFALLVFDECHHLPGPSYSIAAEFSLAPFRLGLTATPEREEYQHEREIYRDFVQRMGIQFGRHDGWAQFLRMTSSSEEGRRAFLAYRRQKTISQASGAKLRLLEQLFQQHRHDRVLVFTSDNETVYRISRRFLIPTITHQTKVKERHATLLGFNEGRYPFLVTSRVLNEGVDVPAANIGIVLSGSGTVREHVQRLGRILRRGEGKRARLYEVVAEDTAEEYVSSRRRQHGAYQR